MRREDLEHLIRAAGAILGERDLIVIGSQAILASFREGELPAPVSRSVEADIVPLDDADGRKSDVVDGAIGEGSPFHELFGVYAHGVGVRTAVLPTGWEQRLIAYENENTNGFVGWCLEPHDLVVSKLVAGRPQDVDYCRALFARRLVDADTVLERLDLLDGTDPRTGSARAAAEALRAHAAGPEER